MQDGAEGPDFNSLLGLEEESWPVGSKKRIRVFFHSAGHVFPNVDFRATLTSQLLLTASADIPPKDAQFGPNVSLVSRV